MRTIARVADWFLYTNLFTAICAVGLCTATERLIGAPAGLVSVLHLFIAGSLLAVYNAPRIVRKAYAGEQEPDFLLCSKRFWFISLFVAGCAMAGFSAFWLSRTEALWCMALGVVTFSYSLPLLPFRRRKRLRDIGWLKILALSVVWTVVTAVLPMAHWGYSVSQYPIEIAARLTFIFALCILFDIRDLTEDKRNNIRTLPTILGRRHSYLAVYGALALFVALSFAQYERFYVLPRLEGAVITAVVALPVMQYLKNNPSDRAYNGLADGLMLVYAILVAFI